MALGVGVYFTRIWEDCGGCLTRAAMAEREGESSLNSTISTNLFFHLYPTLTTEDFPEYVRDERYSLKQESDT